MSLNWEEFRRVFQELIETNTVNDGTNNDSKNPYGPGVSAGFKVLEKFAKEHQLNFKNYDNRVCEIIIGNPNYQKSLGIFAHLDVVPIGDWAEGFKLVEKDGSFYGRGVSDDKGPLLIALLAALNYAKDISPQSENAIRIIVGGDEEKGSSCLHYYFQQLKQKPVTYGFTPDGEFPLVYGEKGMFDLVFQGEYPFEHVISIKTENATNVVPHKVEMILENTAEIRDNLAKNPAKIDYSYQIHEKQIQVEVHGKSVHAALSMDGDNAIYHSFELLNELTPNELIKQFLINYPNAQGIGFDPFESPSELGAMTFNLGSFAYDGRNQQCRIEIDIRYNERTKVDEFLDLLQEINSPLQLQIKRNNQPLIFEKSSRFISFLMQAYQKVSGDYTSPPLVKGGGTYAKHAPNIVAFGPQFPGHNNHIHEDHETISQVEIEKLYKIYYQAISALFAHLEGGM